MWLSCPVVLLAVESQTPIFVPVLLLVFGVPFWCIGLPPLIKDPEGRMRSVAEDWSRSRLLHPLGGGDPDKRFRSLWRWRRGTPVAVIAWAYWTVYFFVDALR